MIKGIVISNGKLRIILTGETDLDKAALKALDGATCKFVTENLKVFEQNVAEGIVIEVDPNKAK